MAAIFVKLYTSLPIYRLKIFRIHHELIEMRFFKDICNSRGECAPHKFQQGDISAPLPNRSGRYQGTTPTTWLNFNTPCKSQLKNAWPFSPTTGSQPRLINNCHFGNYYYKLNWRHACTNPKRYYKLPVVIIMLIRDKHNLQY